MIKTKNRQGKCSASDKSGPIRIYGKKEAAWVFAKLKMRGSLDTEIAESVRKILSDMDLRGFAGLQEYSLKFDRFGLSEENINLTRKQINARALLLTKKQRDAIDFAYNQTLKFQQRIAATIKPIKSGSKYGKTYFMPRPIGRIGIYVPGGLAPLPSSLMMAGACARAAGVRDIVVCTPPRNEGINPAIAYLAKKFGIGEIYVVGGIGAIWLMANGIEGIAKKVDKVCGPGNAYVAEAKSQLAMSGKIGIDMIAGPSEVFILADETANPGFVAADLLAQAEHGPTSSAILVTNSGGLALSVQEEINLQLEKLSRKNEILRALQNYGGIFLVDDMEAGRVLANEFGPEHLEIFCEEKAGKRIIGDAKFAGAVFIDTGEAFADYGLTGGNHILPTGNAVRFSSGLSARDFFIWQYVEKFNRDAQQKLSPVASCFADLEGLEAHSSAAKMRGERQ